MSSRKTRPAEAEERPPESLGSAPPVTAGPLLRGGAPSVCADYPSSDGGASAPAVTKFAKSASSSSTISPFEASVASAANTARRCVGCCSAPEFTTAQPWSRPVSYTHLRAHETSAHL
eukprot:8703199-Alexandrium_andersonii.AAC.1